MLWDGYIAQIKINQRIDDLQHDALRLLGYQQASCILKSHFDLQYAIQAQQDQDQAIIFNIYPAKPDATIGTSTHPLLACARFSSMTYLYPEGEIKLSFYPLNHLDIAHFGLLEDTEGQPLQALQHLNPQEPLFDLIIDHQRIIGPQKSCFLDFIDYGQRYAQNVALPLHAYNWEPSPVSIKADCLPITDWLSKPNRIEATQSAVAPCLAHIGYVLDLARVPSSQQPLEQLQLTFRPYVDLFNPHAFRIATASYRIQARSWHATALRGKVILDLMDENKQKVISSQSVYIPSVDGQIGSFFSGDLAFEAGQTQRLWGPPLTIQAPLSYRPQPFYAWRIQAHQLGFETVTLENHTRSQLLYYQAHALQKDKVGAIMGLPQLPATGTLDVCLSLIEVNQRLLQRPNYPIGHPWELIDTRFYFGSHFKTNSISTTQRASTGLTITDLVEQALCNQTYSAHHPAVDGHRVASPFNINTVEASAWLRWLNTLEWAAQADMRYRLAQQLAQIARLHGPFLSLAAWLNPRIHQQRCARDIFEALDPSLQLLQSFLRAAGPRLSTRYDALGIDIITQTHGGQPQTTTLLAQRITGNDWALQKILRL